MRLIPERSTLPRLLIFPLLVAAASGWALLHWAADTVVRWAHCPLRDATGLPCPTCGGTHAAVALARGRLAEACALNPLVALVALGIGVWTVWALAATFFPPLRREILLGPREKKAARFLAVAVLVLGWAWTIKTYGKF